MAAGLAPHTSLRQSKFLEEMESARKMPHSRRRDQMKRIDRAIDFSILLP